jgi:methylase of polypeptide subunit release factors
MERADAGWVLRCPGCRNTFPVRDAPAWLARRGVLVVELAPHQADAVAQLARDAGFHTVDVRPDLAGRPRALVARVG